jgi:hypothetical protein
MTVAALLDLMLDLCMFKLVLSFNMDLKLIKC